MEFWATAKKITHSWRSKSANWQSNCLRKASASINSPKISWKWGRIRKPPKEDTKKRSIDRIRTMPEGRKNSKTPSGKWRSTIKNKLRGWGKSNWNSSKLLPQNNTKMKRWEDSLSILDKSWGKRLINWKSLKPTWPNFTKSTPSRLAKWWQILESNGGQWKTYPKFLL